MRIRPLIEVPFVIVLVATAQAAETKITFRELPVAVQKAVEQQSKDAILRGFAKEVENGKTEYEAELTVNGHAKDISFDQAGNVVSIEEEVKLESIPEAARNAIQKAAEGGTLRRVESVTESGKSFYEASIRKGGKSTEIQVDAIGARLK